MEREYKVTTGLKLYEQVLEHIKAMIGQGMFKKGDLLPSEKELIEMMGVSRITVREALRLLSEAGVIETRKGKGSYVLIDAAQLAPQADELKSYCEMFINSTNARILLEPAIAHQAALTATPGELAQLGRCLDEACSDSLFHSALVSTTHNPILIDLLEHLLQLETDPALTALVPPVKQKSIAAAFNSHHQKIYDAICEKKPDYAQFYMKEHLEYVLETYKGYFDLFY